MTHGLPMPAGPAGTRPSLMGSAVRVMEDPSVSDASTSRRSAARSETPSRLESCSHGATTMSRRSRLSLASVTKPSATRSSGSFSQRATTDDSAGLTIIIVALALAPVGAG